MKQDDGAYQPLARRYAMRVRLPTAAGFAAAVAVIVAVSAAVAAPGGSDPTFGVGGKVTTDFGDSDAANALAHYSGGFVAAGVTGSVGPFTSNNLDFALARYDGAGALDAGFGAGGKVTTDFGAHDQAFAVAVQPDGRVLAAGSTGNVFSLSARFAIARFNPDGALDSSFGTGGKVVTEVLGFDDEARAILVQPDGKIVAVGFAFRSPVFSSGLPSFALVRYNADGTLDSSFGSGGKVTTEFPGALGASAEAVAALLQPDGKIVAAGFARPGFNTDFGLARYNSDGSLDGTFGSGGRVTTDIGEIDRALALALQPDGKVVAAGTASFGDFTLVRYQPGGAIDTSFGLGGKVSVPTPGNGEAAAVAVQANGKLVAAGRAGPFGLFDFHVIRLTPSGALDPIFGAGGRSTTDFASFNDEPRAVLLQGDGKIVVGGVALTTTSNDFALTRYEGDPVDTTPPTVSCSAAPSTLWPPNHRQVEVTVNVVASDESGSPSVRLTSATSDQPDAALDPEDVPVDVDGWSVGADDRQGLLRAERFESARAYELRYEARDTAGNTATCTAIVTVPKSMRPG